MATSIQEYIKFSPTVCDSFQIYKNEKFSMYSSADKRYHKCRCHFDCTISQEEKTLIVSVGDYCLRFQESAAVVSSWEEIPVQHLNLFIFFFP
jgi:hypothetical protein